VTGRLLLAVLLFLLYWVIRAAVHHGILDADRSRAKRERPEVKDRQ